MSHGHHHHHHVVNGAEEPGWSLLRMSAAARLGLALVISLALWLATLVVII